MIGIRSLPRAHRWRLVAAAALLAAAGGLVAAERLVAPPAPAAGRDVARVREESGPVDATVDTVLAQHRIDLRAVKTWAIRDHEKAVIRRESRIDVPPSFVSIEFNRALHSAMLPLGARVIATEHTKEQTVTMHVRRDGVILRTLVFRTVAEPVRRAGAATSPAGARGAARTTPPAKARARAHR